MKQLSIESGGGILCARQGVYPVLLSIDGLAIQSYSALLGLGLIAAAAVTLRRARRIDPPVPIAATIDTLLAAIIAGVVGARLAYAATHWAYFRDHLDEVWQVWLGGLSWHGGLIGGASGVWLAAHIRLKQAPAGWLDLLAPGTALGTAFGWTACFLSACAFGREVFPAEPLFGIAVDAPDLYGTWAPRLPSQLFGAIWGLIVFGVMWMSDRPPAASSRLAGRPGQTSRWARAARPSAGARFASFVVLYSAGSLLVGFSRADVAIGIGSLNVEQVLDAILLAAGAGWMLVLRLR